MKCPYCYDSIHVDLDMKRQSLYDGDFSSTTVVSIVPCPSLSCKEVFIVLAEEKFYDEYDCSLIDPETIKIIWPIAHGRPPCPKEVPQNISEDYLEACIVLPFSLKASAALSRRCLQNLLREGAKVNPTHLADEIQQVLDTKDIPSYISEDIDAIRHIGNFATHPMKSQHTGEVLDVEPGEAEWNLDVIESLLDFYYVQPAKKKHRRNKINKKLKEAGKPPLKK